MNYTRKEFLKSIGLSAIALTIAPKLNLLALNNNKKSLAIQLWTLKDEINLDLIKTISNIGKIGFTDVENFEFSKGLFWGYSAKEFKKICNNSGLNIISSHCDIYKDFEKKVEDSANIGIKYLITPFFDTPWNPNSKKKTIEDYKKVSELYNKCGEICKKAGIKFAYHNHHYSFTLLENQYPQDILMTYTDPNLVNFEMDIYWVFLAGQNPIEWIKKYPNRFKLCHLKDRVKNIQTNEQESCIFGNGNIDYKNIIPQLIENKFEHFIYEQEKYTEGTPLFCAEKSYNNLNNIFKII